MKREKYILYSTAISLLVGGGVYMATTLQQKKIAVVDAVRLFNNYHMKKELEMQAGGTLDFLSNKLDSLKKVVDAQGHSGATMDNKTLINEYLSARQQLEEQYKVTNQQINEMVWKRLNPMLDEYGRKKGYHLIIGANGMGSVLYNDAYYDITDDVLQHANKTYDNEK